MKSIKKLKFVHFSKWRGLGQRPKVLMFSILFLLLFPLEVLAVPYNTFTRSGEMIVLTQTAYEPYRAITRIGDYALSTPSDLRIGADGLMYIADTGNSRILVATMDGDWVRTIGEGVLQAPRGVFRAHDGLVYVADQDAQAVFVFDESGEVVRTITRPEHPLFGRTSPFMPLKVVVDLRGNIFITSQGNTNGIIQIAAETGEFLGYFGANTTNVTWFTALRRMLYNEEQMAMLTGINPITVTNMAVDSRGLIYTVSSGDAIGLKRLNVAGRDILNIPEQWNAANFISVAVSENGNIFAASHQWIHEYTSEGELLFAFGGGMGGGGAGGQQRMGHFQSISAIAVQDSTLFVMDDTLNIIQVLRPTEFLQNVHHAFYLFNNGLYTESMYPWNNIMQMNAMFAYAGVGLGEAHFRNGDFDQALAFFRRGFNREGYSDAFWELRSNWMRDNLATFIVWAFLLMFAWKLLKFTDRRFVPVLAPARTATAKIKGITLFSQCTYAFRNITNPADAAYGIRYENKGSFKAAFILLFVFYVLYVLERYFSGFLFRTVPEGQYDLVGDAAFIAVIVGLPIICCYLVSTITDGEASFKQLFVGIIYSFAPLFLLKPLVIVMGNVLTLNEAFFIGFTNFIAYTWTAVLIFLAIKNLNDYDFPKAFKTVFLAIFVTVILAMILFILYVLILQVANFGTSVTREAVFRFVQ